MGVQVPTPEDVFGWLRESLRDFKEMPAAESVEEQDRLQKQDFNAKWYWIDECVEGMNIGGTLRLLKITFDRLIDRTYDGQFVELKRAIQKLALAVKEAAPESHTLLLSFDKPFSQVEPPFKTRIIYRLYVILYPKTGDG